MAGSSTTQYRTMLQLPGSLRDVIINNAFKNLFEEFQEPTTEQKRIYAKNARAVKSGRAENRTILKEIEIIEKKFKDRNIVRAFSGKYKGCLDSNQFGRTSKQMRD